MKNFITLLFIAFSFYMNADVKLPLIFNDSMVLQRNKPIPVWGWADANEKIEIQFNKQIIKTKADKNGKWMVHMKPEIAGGPYKMIIKAKNSITLNDILVGEVWICSGQSNMEFTVDKVLNSKEEINNSDFPMIRQFLVERDLSSQPKSDLKAAHWDVCNKTTVGKFTAVGYFFAKKLYTELKIPIGIIHSSWGGSNIETWTSKKALETSDEFKGIISEIPNIDIDSLSKSRIQSLRYKVENLQNSKISDKDEAFYKEASFDDSSWPEMNVPELWESQQLDGLDGVVWMRKSITISKQDAQSSAVLELAKIDDQDVTYINGVEVGKTNAYDEDRIYKIPSGILKEGRNTIAIKITDYSGGGGIYGKANNLKLIFKQASLQLAGQWKFKVIDVKSEMSPNSYPSLLYNAMINPLVPYAIKGVLWYQGEANVTRAEQYSKAFPLMINDWRNQWNQGDFPFYFVQLSSYDAYGGNSNKGSNWAELREAQTKTLQLKNTGMCTTIDIGNANDIHPINKQDVGRRLAAIALHNLYDKDNIFSGPTYKAMELKGQEVIISFENIGSGLLAVDKYGYLKGFEIAGADKKFYYAKAYLKGNKAVIYNDDVLYPKAVRYGWADDAGDCNLYNKENFPAVPFRTDNWDLITKGIKYSIER